MGEILSITEISDDPRSTSLGEIGENLAVQYLTNAGYRVVVTNFKVPVGRNSKGVSVTGEIDVIAMDGDTLCFVEVKTRRSEDFVPIKTAVDRQKQRQIIRTGKVYRRLFNISDTKVRYDIVTVLMPLNAEPRVELIKGFWTESSFNKQNWTDGGWYEFA